MPRGESGKSQSRSCSARPLPFRQRRLQDLRLRTPQVPSLEMPKARTPDLGFGPFLFFQLLAWIRYRVHKFGEYATDTVQQIDRVSAIIEPWAVITYLDVDGHL